MNITDFLDKLDARQDMTPAVTAAIDACRLSGDKRLEFPQGRYHFWPDRAKEQYHFISNNDEGLKRIAFLLQDLEDFEIVGDGSDFIFHGYILPFVVNRSANIRMRGFTIDWARHFHSEALVLESFEDGVGIEIPERYPYKIAHNRLVFTGEGSDRYEIGNILEFDPQRRETAFRVHDNYAIRDWHSAEEMGPGKVRFRANFATRPTPGNVLAIMDGRRLCPTITLADSKDITIEDITIHHSGGMGVIAQRTENIRIDSLRVTAREGTGGIISATADATHFVSCAGEIVIENCLFENQMDDATNVHGIYGRISAIISPTEVEYELVHEQQVGIDLFEAGDPLEIVSHTTLDTLQHNRIAGVNRLNKIYTRITLESALPEDLKIKDVVANLRWTPNVTIRNCRSRGNRARGFLLTSGGRVLVENNYFHIPGAAILIEGDANYWFESGAVNDVTIRGNHFDNCNYGVWGRATVEINGAVEPEYRECAIYHRNIRIDGNTFDDFNGLLLYAHCVDGLTFRQNVIRPSEEYPRVDADKSKFDVEYCSNVEIDGNLFEGA